MAQRWWTLAQQDMDAQVASLGHILAWSRLPHEAGTELEYEGECRDCGATVKIGPGWSSCATVRDARRETCSGRGTAALTEVEQERSSALIGDLVNEYAQASADAPTSRPQTPFRNPLAPEGQCGLMSKDGHTCIRSLNKRGTHNGKKWGGVDEHVGTHPDSDCTTPFSDDDLLLA